MDANRSAQLRACLLEKLSDSIGSKVAQSTTRRLHGRLELPGKATAVIGMRRAGKTTLLHQLRKARLERGVPRERLLHIGFEDERLAGLGADQLQVLIEDYYRRYPALRQQETITWCFDEIQLVPGWERFVRRLLDSEQVEIFLSGSSASLLARELATSMRGRSWELVLHPFAFDEVLRHLGQTPPGSGGALPSKERSSLERAWLDYLAGGGFPEAQGLDAATRQQLLRDYVDVAMLRDVAERHGIGNLALLRWLVRHLLANPAASFSAEKFYASARSQGLRASRDSVHAMVAALEDCFLVRVVWLETTSERQRMVNPRKVYPVDPGLIPVFDRTGRDNLGHALETVVLLELERRRAEVTYVKTPQGREIDFLARWPGGGLDLIQVCADPTHPDTAARELRALEEGAGMYPRATRRLLTLTADRSPPSAPPGVRVQPAYAWILEAPTS